ncbi:MAG: hypothetical protein JJT77_01570 [Crocinitomicaceae bacterium]|nr:hypothetical protein [Crocinitomicaceae bacterium]
MRITRLKFWILSLSFAAISSLAAQKTNVVSAAVEYQKYEKAFIFQKFDDARKALESARGFIDPAMQDAATKEDPKAHLYNAKIYFGLIELSSLPDNEDLKDLQSEETMEMIKKSLAIARDNRKFKRDAEDFVNQKVQQATMIGTMMFEQENFELAFAGFAGAFELRKMLDIEDDDLKNNALVSAQNAITRFKEKEKLEEALTFIEQVTNMFPNSTDLTIQGVNIALDMGDMKRAEEFFDAAAASDPNNSMLFASMGSIYLAAGDELSAKLKGMQVSDPNFSQVFDDIEILYGKAEKNLIKALEIDQNNTDAAYNLGVLYLGKGEKLTLEANQMNFNDPRYNETIEKSEEMYRKAIEPLELFIAQYPNEAGVLQVLFQVHRKAGNTEKALEYKRRAEEATGN